MCEFVCFTMPASYLVILDAFQIMTKLKSRQQKTFVAKSQAMQYSVGTGNMREWQKEHLLWEYHRGAIWMSRQIVIAITTIVS